MDMKIIMRWDLVEIEFIWLYVYIMCVCVYIRTKKERSPAEGPVPNAIFKKIQLTAGSSAVVIRVKSFFSLLVVFITTPYPKTNRLPVCNVFILIVCHK